MTKDEIDLCLEQLPLPGPWQTEPVNGGVVNSSWKVSNAKATYFLKMQRSDELNQIDRKTEVSLQQQLSRMQLCPHVHYVSDNQDLVLFDWIDAPSLANSEMPERNRMRVVADTLARIHRCEPAIESWSLYERIMHYCETLADRMPGRAKAYHQQLQHFANLVRDWDNQQGCLCHNDLSLDHILMSEPVQVVDWEYAGYGHPYFDIASCIEINELDNNQVRLLCQFYSEAKRTEVTPGEIATWRALVGILNELWFALQKE